MEQLIDQEIDRALEQFCRHGFTRRMSEDAARRHLERFAARVASATRSATLISIRSAEEAAEAWGVSVRRAQAHISHLNERKGVGARIGRAWLITEDEIVRHRPGPPGRPATDDDGEPKRSTMLAVEVKLESGTYYVPLATANQGTAVLLPMEGGQRVLLPQDVRVNWDAWVSDLVPDSQLLTADELAAQHPGIAIDREN